MADNPTRAQRAAIEYDGGNMLISAAAGSGKTTTMMQRVVHLISDADKNITPDDMLIVTFTKEAANQLRSKVKSAILESIENNSRLEKEISGLEAALSSADLSEDDREKITQELASKRVEIKKTINRRRASSLMMSVGRADISTIHSFLLSAIRPHFTDDAEYLNRAPDTGVIDDTQAKVIRADIMRRIVSRYFASADGQNSDENIASFSELADILSKVKDSSSLDNTLIGIADKLTNSGENALTLLTHADRLSHNAAETFLDDDSAGAAVRKNIIAMAQYYHSKLANALDMVSGIASEKFIACLENAAETCDSLISLKDTYDYSKFREQLALCLTRKEGHCDRKPKGEEGAYAKTVRDGFWKELEKAYSYFIWSEQQLTDSFRQTSRLLRRLSEVLEKYFTEYDKSKRRLNCVDYSDLETIAHRLFCRYEDGHAVPTDFALEVGKKYKYIFIDEYQDTNRIQDDIFTCIGSSSVRFMVGDIKQAIYNFRGADPSVFRGYSEKWKKLDTDTGAADDAADSSDGVKLFMSENFRCDEPIIDFVNLVSDYMFPYGEISYDSASDPLIFGKGSESKAKTQVCIIDCPQKSEDSKAEKEDDEDSGETASAHVQAVFAASEISRLIKAGGRPSDFAILLRTNKHADAYRRQLRKYGIESKIKNSSSPTEAMSARLIMCLLNLVDNPMREIYCAGALHSPIFGFSGDDIIRLKKRYSCPLWVAVTRAANEYQLKCGTEATDFGYDFSPEKKEETADAESADIDYTSYEEIGMFDSEASDENSDAPDGSFAIPDELYRKCLYAAVWTHEERTHSSGMKADRYLESLLNRTAITNLPEIVSSESERSAVTRLYEMARSAEKNRFCGISGFIEAVNDAEENGARDEDEASKLNDTEAVTIESIHASKGKEYKILFLCECDKKYSTSDSKQSLLFSKKSGFGMKLTAADGIVLCDNALRKSIDTELKEEQTCEEMRILYVAMTRAREKLYIVASAKDNKDATGFEKLESAAKNVLTASEYSDLGMAAESLRHEVHDHDAYISIILASIYRRYGTLRFNDEDTTSRCFVIREITPDMLDEMSSHSAADDEEDENTVLDDGELLLRRRIIDNMTFEYADSFLGSVPSKLTVSKLRPDILDVYGTDDTKVSLDKAEKEEKPAGEILLPAFMSKNSQESHAANPAEIGTATHLFMQFMDINNLAKTMAAEDDRTAVENEIERLKKQRFISESDCSIIDRKALVKFLHSQLFDEMTEAYSESEDNIHREFRFNVLRRACDYTMDSTLKKQLSDSGTMITVQGVVDCIYCLDGRYTLVDYKTDRVPYSEAERILLERHSRQLNIYRSICSAIFDVPEAEITACIYSCETARCYTVPYAGPSH